MDGQHVWCCSSIAPLNRLLRHVLIDRAGLARASRDTACRSINRANRLSSALELGTGALFGYGLVWALVKVACKQLGEVVQGFLRIGPIGLDHDLIATFGH